MKKKFILQADYQVSNKAPRSIWRRKRRHRVVFCDIDNKGCHSGAIMWETHPFIEMEVEEKTSLHTKDLRLADVTL